MATKYKMMEIKLTGPSEGNPFLDTELRAEFKNESLSYSVSGFYDGDGVYIIRFLPMEEGRWTYRTVSNRPELDKVEGEFQCEPALSGDHGPVRVKDSYGFAYEDGTRYLPFGTTAYAWTSQNLHVIEETIKTLKTSPFNKMRMSPMPKHYRFNYNEPELYPFEGGIIEGAVPEPRNNSGFYVDPAYSFDFTRPNPAYWRRFDMCVEACLEMGIECDLILFYPYDRWGFACMGRENNLRYIKYVVSRYASYPNIWWSMANEWDLCKQAVIDFNEEDWEIYADEVQKHDYVNHLLSIHNFMEIYDQSRPWITHLSLQKIDHYSHVTTTEEYKKYGKPIVWDEVAYEGDIDTEFGNISGEEMTMRFWEAMIRGAYCTHGETYLRDDDLLWWAKGGYLEGTSLSRIGFLRSILEDLPGCGFPYALYGHDALLFGKRYEKEVTMFGRQMKRYTADYMLYYLNFMQSKKFQFNLHNEINYTAEIIDTWNMTIRKLPGTYSGEVMLDLPGRPYMAVRFSKV